MKFQRNHNGSIEFATQKDVCIGRIIELQINADLSGANSRNACDDMLAAECPVNILDFSGVTHINSGAWNRFSKLALDLFLKGHKLRFVGLSGHALRTFQINKLDNFLPRYVNIEDAIKGLQTVTPEAETRQSADIKRLTEKKEIERNER